MSFEFDSNGGPQDFDKIERQEAASERGERAPIIRIDFDLCENSGVCAQVCPEDVLDFEGGTTKIVKPEACTECWICVENCVSAAIEIG